MIGTLRVYSLVNGFDWDDFLFGFLLGSPVGVFLGMPLWLAPSEVLLGRLLF